MSALDGLNRVTAHATDDEWRTLWNALRRVAREHQEFTTDLVWDIAWDFRAERRLMGAVIRQAVADGRAGEGTPATSSTDPCDVGVLPHGRPCRSSPTLVREAH